MPRTACWQRFAIVMVALIGAEAGAAEAVITPQQIEADFLRQQELRECSAKVLGPVEPADDAAGGVDGVKNGRWGFHTLAEKDPWWQVDLGQVLPIDRVAIYNRCDATASRNSRIKILLSVDGRQFQQVYQHNGQTFYGHSDGKPLVASLAGAKGRWVRLQLAGTFYFHLDEVEVYAVGSRANAALRRPATQSSTSTWSVSHAAKPPDTLSSESIVTAAERGLKLADDLTRRGVTVAEDRVALVRLRDEARRLPDNSSVDTLRKRYVDVSWAVRRLALRNPLLDFDRILFVKGAPTLFPHMSDQFYGWWSRPGGGVFILAGFRTGQPALHCLTADMPPGSFIRPELSYDGRKVLFAYAKHYPHVADLPDKVEKSNLPEDAFYHLFEMNVDGSGRRQLTRGRYDDFDARYLPDGRIVFLSTRKGQFLQCSAWNTSSTTAADLPDSYVRCGGGNSRPVPVFTLHGMDAQGGNLHPLSAFENFEWTPAVTHDGRILYTRWDYIDRFNGHFFSLWSTNPDGTSAQLVYKNYTVRPQVACEAFPIPGSTKLIFTASAHHSIIGGSLVLLDRTRGTEGDAPIVRLTPEVPFPETEKNVDSYYANPHPLSEEHYLVGWSDQHLPPHCRVDDTKRNPVNAMGVYLYDAFGNLTLLHRDPTLSSGCPIPVRPRPRPPVYADRLAEVGDEATFLVQNVYQGLEGVPQGSIKSVRVIGVPPKVQPHMNTPSLGVSREEPAKVLLGSAPVEADGSAYFRVPSGLPVLFQTLDADGLAIQTMRSLAYATPGQAASCVGCHEPREAAPAAASRFPLAARRPPSQLTPGPEGSWPLRYDQLVQPVLDRHCVSCHRPDSQHERHAKLDLTPAKSYDSLLTFADKDLHKLVYERDRSLVGDCAARRSKLWAILTGPQGHEGVHLDTESRLRLAVWMDLYAPRQGFYSAEQETQLRHLRVRLSSMLAP